MMMICHLNNNCFQHINCFALLLCHTLLPDNKLLQSQTWNNAKSGSEPVRHFNHFINL